MKTARQQKRIKESVGRVLEVSLFPYSNKAITLFAGDKQFPIIYSLLMSEIPAFSTIQTISVMALPLVAAIVLHEVAHGYVAYLKGDNTAKEMGRLTLNPLAHIDPFGTVIMPILFYLSVGMMFAFAKPVPVNFYNLRRPKEDMVWVAAAGPATNVLLALLSAGAIKLLVYLYPQTISYTSFVYQQLKPPWVDPILFPIVGMLFFSVIINVVLAVINLIPIPPADGGRIVVGLLPNKQAEIYSRLERYGMFLLVFIVMFNPFGFTHKFIWPLIISIVNSLI